jgi:hypothetical protein
VSDPTMELIRRANPYPGELPPLPIEPVLRRLGEDGSLQPLARRRMPLFSSGGVMAAISVVVALAVAVLAITAFSHRHSQTVTGGSPVSSSRQQLLQTLGVLRRPQTKTDLLATRPGGAGGELPGIFRVASAGTVPEENQLAAAMHAEARDAVGSRGEGWRRLSGGDFSDADRTLNFSGATRRGSRARAAGPRALHHHQHDADQRAGTTQSRAAPFRLRRQRR